MNILQLLPQLNEGGVERGTVDLTKFLVQNGHRAIVISKGGRLVKELRENGVIHYTLPVHEKFIFTIIRMIFKVARILEQEKIDIVHARSRVPAWIGYFAYRLYLSRSAKKDLLNWMVFLTTCHGYYKRHLFSHIMKWGKYVIVVSSVIGKHMRNHFGVPFYRLRLIHRGVDLNLFQYKEPKSDLKDGCKVGMIGRITPLKGHTDFLKAMAKVVRIVPKVKVVIAGEVSPGRREYKRELDLLIRQLGLERYVEFVGHIDNIVELLHSLDLLVLATTTHEAFGRVLIEAGACGVPVVATQVGGVMDIIKDKVNGLLVSPGNPPELAEAITKLLRERGLAREFAQKARKYVEIDFSLRKMTEQTLLVYKDALQVLRILIIKYSALGDVVLAIPSIRAIKKHFPQARITVLTSRQAREMIAKLPYVDDVVIIDKNRYQSRFQMLKEIGKILRNDVFDLVIDLQNNKTSHLLSYLSLSPRRIGYDNGKFSFLLNYRLKDTKETISPLEHQFRLLNSFGIKCEDKRLELFIDQRDEEYIDNFLNNNWLSASQILVGMNIGASSRWFSKRWPLERFAYLAEELSSKGIRIIITGTEEDREEIKRNQVLLRTKPINTCGRTTISQLAALIKRCAVYITGDSCPLHLAMAVDTPTVALFGPTDYRKHIAYPKDNLIVIHKKIFCGPCYRPACKDYECMRRITVQEVADAVIKLLRVRFPSLS
ncbi:MAG: lipopolysaccharide heptosyltransferase II [Candidatus Omnitrophica bacterium]|nr:lipopolysaccharide heptosyltransferase II [Candidatus Omnitrophota bacterium]